MANDDQGRLRNAVLTNSVSPQRCRSKQNSLKSRQYAELVLLCTELEYLRAGADTRHQRSPAIRVGVRLALITE
jgi:hypothetical protein